LLRGCRLPGTVQEKLPLEAATGEVVTLATTRLPYTTRMSTEPLVAEPKEVHSTVTEEPMNHTAPTLGDTTCRPLVATNGSSWKSLLAQVLASERDTIFTVSVPGARYGVMVQEKEEEEKGTEAVMVASRVEEPKGYRDMDREPPVRVQPLPDQDTSRLLPTTLLSVPEGEGESSCRVPESVAKTPELLTTEVS